MMTERGKEVLDTKTRSKHTKSTKRQRTLAKGKPVRMTCPYCGRPMQLRNGDTIYKDNVKNRKIYVCAGYPGCDSYVRAQDGTLNPIGTPANSDLRRLRHDAHNAFDLLWKRGFMTKKEAYNWLGLITGLPEDMAHIGEFREALCSRVITESMQLLATQTAAAQRRPNEEGCM